MDAERNGGAGPLVSVIVPVYNVRSYIVECLESIRNQTYRNLEIIIIDDGSTDGTGEYCDTAAAMDDRICVLHQENGGVVSARGAGICFSHGTYTAFVDGDDWIEPGMIEKLVEQIGTYDMASVGVYQEQSPDCLIERVDRFPAGVYAGEERMRYLFGKMIYDQESGILQPMTSWIYNKLYISSRVKTVHERVGKDLIFAEDSVFLYLYMLECDSIVICDQCFYHYRYREGSAIHKSNVHMLADINKVYLALLDTFRAHPLGKELLFQLQRWVVLRVCLAMNEAMEFDQRIHIPGFVADVKGLEGKRIVLYGAGRVGQDTYRQLMQFGYCVVFWADRAYRRHREKGLDVRSPSEITGKTFDVVMIAIDDEKIAREIESALTESGIPAEKIVWNKPMKTY